MRVAILLLAGACGRIGFDGVAPDALDDADATAMTDASFVRPGCTWTAFETLPGSLTTYGTASVTASGQLVISTTGVFTNPGGFTTPPMSMIGRSTALELAQIAAQPNARTGIGWHASPSTNALAHFHVIGGELVLVDDVGATNTRSAHLPGEHRWLRLREAGGKLFGETSADGIVWTLFGMTGSLDASSAYLDAALDMPAGNLAGPDQALFDNYLDCAP